ncbi:MAG: hypothetical protein RL653_1499 [Pseudomonadota bacterium]|jgi:hypothetical protein
MKLPAAALTLPFAAALWPRAQAFSRALEDPREAQEEVFTRLRRVLPALSGLQRMEEVRALPLHRWDVLAADMEAVASGDHGRLSRSPLVRFERSGGSSGAQKLVPMTRASLQEMNRALQPWLWSLYTQRPGVANGCAYWSISPVAQGKQRTAGGIPVGAEDDAEYFPAALQQLIGRVMAVPQAVAALPSVEACRYVTLLHLLHREDLSLVSVWSPTFLALLVQSLDANLERLLTDLERGTCTVPGDTQVAGDLLRKLAPAPSPARASHLRRAAGSGPLQARDLWPGLALVSVWTDAAAATFLPEALARFGGVPVEGKGLLATEGAVSLPWAGAPAPVLAVRSHLLEFLDEAERPHFAHELEEGRTYEVVLTTGAGLVRYRLGDRVQVVGRHEATPCVRFVGRGDLVSDLVGEKLAAAFVGNVLADVQGQARFAMLAPVVGGGGRRYRLYVESALDDRGLHEAAAAVERRLAEGHPYRYARQLGQLSAVDVMRVRDGAQAYERGCIRRGQRAGDIKPTPLHPRTDWDELFGGVVLPPPGEER